MTSIKILWAWDDGEGLYQNEADSLEGIIEEILEYYFDEDMPPKIKASYDQLIEKIKGMNAITSKTYSIQQLCNETAEYLRGVAMNDGRPDKFSICFLE